MKKYLIFLMIVSSCSHTPSNTNKDIDTDNVSNVLETDTAHIPEYVVDTVIGHYNDTSWILKSEITDSSVSIVWYLRALPEEEIVQETGVDTSLIYKSDDTNYSIEGTVADETNNESDILGIGFTIDLSKLTRDNVVGDINNDGKDDLIITVSTTTGGNAIWQEIFAFVFQENKYVLKGITSASEICGCDIGDFMPERFEGGRLKGKSICWEPDDAHCCPSHEYETELVFDGQKFKFFAMVENK